MGVDITMHIVRGKNEIIYENIFDGRNSEWFDNISGRGTDIYDEFPAKYITSVKELPFNIDSLANAGHYGFKALKVKDFIDWFARIRPDIDAGWVSTYEAWAYKNKGIIPEVSHYMPIDECPKEDLVFIEVKNKYDCSKWLYDFLYNHEDIEEDDYIVYWFDC